MCIESVHDARRTVFDVNNGRRAWLAVTLLESAAYKRMGRLNTWLGGWVAGKLLGRLVSSPGGCLVG